MTGALPDVLDRVAGELRAGAAPLRALAEATGGSGLPQPLAGDLAEVVDRAARDGLGPALAAWAAKRPQPAVGAVAAVLSTATEAGGPAAPALEGLGRALRDRHDAAAEVAALSAQARMSAIVVGAAPIVSLGLSLLADPRVTATLLGTAPGRACLSAGIALDALAAFWMARVVRCDH